MKTRVVGGGLLAVLFSLQAWGQIGTWKNYTSMQNVRSIARAGDVVWAATSGGLFAWKEGSESYQKLTNADGLETTDLTAVAIDNNGDVWIGTSIGIVYAFSPKTNLLRSVKDIYVKAEPDKRINGLSIVGDTLLISSNYGLSLFQIARFQFGDTYRHFGALTGNSRVAVRAAALFNGKIWATVSDGLGTNSVASADLSNPNLLLAEAWTLQSVGATGTIPKQFAIFNGKLYAGTTTGLFERTGSAWSTSDSLGGKNIVALSPSATVLSIVDASNFVYTISTPNTFSRYGSQVQFAVNAVAVNSSAQPIVGTLAGGVMTFSNTWTQHFPNGPGANPFLSIAVDLDGYIWGASGSDGNGKGFFRFDGNAWKTFNRQNSPSLTTDDYNRASVGCNGDVWLGVWGHGGVVRMPRGAERVDSTNVYAKNKGISSIIGDSTYFVIASAVCDNNGNTWMPVMVPNDKRVLAIRKADGSWTTLSTYIAGSRQNYLSDAPVMRSLAVDASNNIWAAAVHEGNTGLICLNNRGSVSDSVADIFLRTTDGLPSDVITTIVVDRDNDIWVGTDRGIAIILNPSNPTGAGGIASYKPLPGIGVNAIAIDPLNQKWVATNNGVVLLSRDGTQTLAQYNVENTNGKIIDNVIKDVAVDSKSGTVYFATINGLSSLTTTAAQPKTDFDEITVSPNPYRIPSAIPLTIDGLIENSIIKILTIDGHLVREVATPGGRIGFWDGKDESGKSVSSGVYLIIAYSETQKDKIGKGKVAVLRK